MTADRALSFGARAELYDRLRPGYPPAAVAALAPEAGTVVDVGAGTGKLTAALLERGLTVVAVEPDAAMRAVLAARHPAADVRAGTGEALPVADGGARAVLYAQSWHWVDGPRAAAEALRVLRPGGRLGMIGNVHDESVPWVREMVRICDVVGTGRDQPPPPLTGFGPPHGGAVRWAHRMRRDEVVELATTWSPVAALPEPGPVLGELADLLRTVPGEDGWIDVPYVCTVHHYKALG